MATISARVYRSHQFNTASGRAGLVLVATALLGALVGCGDAEADLDGSNVAAGAGTTAAGGTGTGSGASSGSGATGTGAANGSGATAAAGGLGGAGASGGSAGANVGGTAGAGNAGAAGAATGGVGGGTGGTGGTGTGGATGANCDDVPPPAQRSLALDGVDDHVTMGVASALGLSTFTLEAWVKRTGAGVTASSGAGGLQITPVIAKGRGESDGSNVDCNYLFGFSGDVLAVDFEDLASGANHPHTGKLAVQAGEWHHIAVSFDGSTYRLYVDGQLDSTLNAGATPRLDSIQHFAIGAALDSKGVAAGAFAGQIDEVRVWNVARSQAALAASMNTTVSSAPGLVGRWALDAGVSAEDSAGTNPGTLKNGAAFVDSGAPIGAGKPPLLSALAPASGATVIPGSRTLSVTVTDPESHPLSVEFAARRVPAPEKDFTIVVLPDTQYYSASYPDTFKTQTKWIMDHVIDRNIVAVIHNGDIVDTGSNETQWKNADAAMSTLELATPLLPVGMPYGVAVGNHDQAPNGSTGNTTLFNKYFGPQRFDGRSYYAGHLGTGNENNTFTFAVGSLKFVVVSIEYDTTQDPSVLTWVKGEFAKYPDHLGIVNSHYIVGTGNPASFGTQGKAIYDGLKDVPNLYYMTCGHIAGEGRRVDAGNGHDIHTMLADYQGRANGGDGWFRIWEVSPSTKQIAVKTYSPKLLKWETDADSEFTIPLPDTSPAAPFVTVGALSSVKSGGTASATISGLKAGESIEWRVTANDCSHTSTAVSTFQVQ